jgi:16S rRNA (cytosine967-C5)-methyltransferase
MAFGTLRFLGEIDAVLALTLERPASEPVRNLLRVALYQLAHTRAAPHAIVDHAVSAVQRLRQPAAKALVNAVLRNFLRRRESLLGAARAGEVGRYSHPKWWIDKLRAQYPAQYRAMLEQANGRPPLTLRVNARAAPVGRCLERLAAAGIGARHLGGVAVMLERAVPVERIPGFKDGEVSVQDAAAQHAAVALDAPDGARVLDACAAPGGKTAHMLERADVDLTALDIEEERLARVRANLDRLRLEARVIRGDAAAHAWWDGQLFTHILADVPCSGSGVARRHPDIKWLRRPEDISAFAQRQREILDALWQVLGRGGKLLYSTCSVFHEENNAQIERFLERHPDAGLLPLPEPQTEAQRLAGQILPDERHDGFFYALLDKS